MATEQPQQRSERRPGVDIVGSVVGLLVFLGGIAMIVAVFMWTYHLFDNIDEEIGRTQVSRPPVAPAEEPKPAASDTSGAAESPQPDKPPARPVEAKPHGPGVAQVAAILGLKILALLILALCGSLVAAKGAQLAGAYRGKAT
jgi:hypothetical protein